MTGWNPARLLAPIALVATAVALFGIVASGGGGTAGDGAAPSSGQTKQTPTPTPAKKTTTRKTYTVKPGDTPSAIAEQAGIPLDQLLELNPDLDPQSLNPGDKLRIR